MRNRTIRSFLTVLMLCIVGSGALAQNSELVNVSYDPKADSIFFAKMQKKMDKIRREQHRPTVALVLAGGGAKGASHIGVLKYLEEKGIPVDFVAGTSMGGLMGGMYSLGYSATEIDSLVRSIDWNMMMSDKIPMEYYSYERKMYKGTYLLDIPFTGVNFMRSLPSGILYGLNVYNMLGSVSVGYQQDIDFSELPIPFCCVATEMVTQKEKRWTSGSFVNALRSTMSIPAYFTPVRIDSMILSDGGTKNNYPADIAKAAGADIIIGVLLTSPLDYEDVNNVATLLSQLARYSGGGEALVHNEHITNVLITPDVTGYTSLSFGTEEIATLIEHGYQAAALHEREIDSIVRIVGKRGTKLQNTKAINCAETRVNISAIDFVGLSEKEKAYITERLPIREGGGYFKKDFEMAQAAIYGTMAFSHVTFQIVGDGSDNYKVVFYCDKRSPHSFGLGLRMDTEEWFEALLNATFNRNLLYGHSYGITARLSASPYLKLEWIYTPLKGPKVGAFFKTSYRTVYGTDTHIFNHHYYEKSWHNELRLFVSENQWSQVDLNAGVRVEHTPYVNLFSEAGFQEIKDWRNYYPYLFMRFTYDTRNRMYFPEKGLHITLNGDYNFYKTAFVGGGIRGAIPVCSFFTIDAAVNSRFIFGDSCTNGYMDNYVGGMMAGRYYEHQIPFVGYNGEKTCDRMLSTVNLELRFKVYKNTYLSLIGAAMHDGNTLKTMQKPVVGAGLQVGYLSKFGPLTANIHWNSTEKSKVGFYLSAGYDF
jgi:NTE family protein